MDYVTYNLHDSKVQTIISSNRELGKLITHIGPCQLALEPIGFTCLLKYIVGQQISDKARETIWNRLCDAFNHEITPDAILAINEDVLRGIGISKRKIEYIKTLSTSIVNKTIELEEINARSNEEIVKTLTSLRGIGQWTAEMYLIFSLGRENVIPHGDGTIKRIIQWLYNLDKLPTNKMVADYFIGFENYATIVSAYMWCALSLGLTKNPFSEIASKPR